MKYGCQSMVGKIESIIIKHPKDAFISQKHLHSYWEQYNYISCPHYDTAVNEFEEFARILHKYIPNVHYLPFDDSVGLDSIYTHDPVKITDNGAILLKPGKVLRQNEPEALKQYVSQVGIPILGEISGSGRVEGGDVVWINERTVAVARGYRTNDEGIRQLKELMAGTVDELSTLP